MMLRRDFRGHLVFVGALFSFAGFFSISINSASAWLGLTGFPKHEECQREVHIHLNSGTLQVMIASCRCPTLNIRFCMGTRLSSFFFQGALSDYQSQTQFELIKVAEVPFTFTVYLFVKPTPVGLNNFYRFWNICICFVIVNYRKLIRVCIKSGSDSSRENRNDMAVKCWRNSPWVLFWN